MDFLFPPGNVNVSEYCSDHRLKFLKMFFYLRYFMILMCLLTFGIILFIAIEYSDHQKQRSDEIQIAQQTEESSIKKLQYTPALKKPKKKNILYWRSVYGDPNFLLGHGDVFGGCPFSHCYATADRNYLDSVKTFDAILFNGIEFLHHDLPNERSPHQRYVFFSYESTASRSLNTLDFMLEPNFYNWTMSFRLDSDVVRPYRVIRDRETGEVAVPLQDSRKNNQWREFNKMYTPTVKEENIIKGKTKMAAWFVSHCQTNSRRELLAKQLQKHFDVDIYGTCGPKSCSPAGHNEEECFSMAEKDYFFYLSFENTLCNDYVTEKFFLPLRKYVIPVVYGGSNYSIFAPPHSYINVLDFNTADDLANYLIELSKNPEEYASYFWWKNFYKMENSTEYTLCELCKKLHDENMPRKSIEVFRNWYEIDQCQLPNQLSWLKNLK